MTRWTIMHNTECGWEFLWFPVDGEPVTYPTKEEAEEELMKFFMEIEAEIAQGARAEDEGFDAEDFEIMQVRDASSSP